MSFLETANTRVPADILSCYLQESLYEDNDVKSLTQNYFEIYKKCNEYIRNSPNEPIGRKHLSELMQLNIQSSLAHYMAGEIVTGNQENIKDSVKYISDKMAQFIEESKEFKDYKNIILQKLEEARNPKPSQNSFVPKKIQHNDNYENHFDHVVIASAFMKTSGQKSGFIQDPFILFLEYLCFLFVVIFI